MEQCTLLGFRVNWNLLVNFFRRIYDNGMYCMKIISIGNLTADEVKNVIKEAHFLSKVTSPYVIQYFDSFADNVSFLYFMI
jgi:hypothetical protein